MGNSGPGGGHGVDTGMYPESLGNTKEAIVENIEGEGILGTG